MARQPWKATSGKKLLAAFRRRGWTITTNANGDTIATKDGVEHLITFSETEILRASLVELWCNWLDIRPEDIT